MGTWEHHRASLVAQTVKSPPAMRVTCVRSLGREDALEEGMAAHSSYSCLESPLDEQLGRPQGRRESDMTEAA